MHTRIVAVTLVLLVAASGCVYTRGNIHRSKTGYDNYPTSVEAEYERRKTRRRHALIAAPLEIIGGAAITYLAIFGASSPSMAESVPGVLADAGKELLARLLFASAGAAITISGVGDGLLGAIDPAFDSPLVRDGRLVSPTEVDALAPPRAPRFVFQSGIGIAEYGVGGEVAMGLSHWVSSSLRLRYAALAQFTTMWHSADRRLLGGGEMVIEHAFSREHLGLYPSKSLGLYLAGGWAAIEDRTDVPMGRGGLELGLGRGMSYRLGAAYSSGDRRPQLEFSMRTDFPLD